MLYISILYWDFTSYPTIVKVSSTNDSKLAVLADPFFIRRGVNASFAFPCNFAPMLVLASSLSNGMVGLSVLCILFWHKFETANITYRLFCFIVQLVIEVN